MDELKEAPELADIMKAANGPDADARGNGKLVTSKVAECPLRSLGKVCRELMPVCAAFFVFIWLLWKLNSAHVNFTVEI
jgi:hypothetical protein